MSYYFTSERLQFCVIVACLTHLLIIFGVTWKPLSNKVFPTKPPLEITIATNPSETPAQNAKFSAPTHQEASSPVHTELLPKNTQVSKITANEVTQVAQLPQPQAQIETSQEKNNSVTTTTQTDESVTVNPLPENENSSNFMSEEQTLLSQRIASLTAELALQQQQYAQQPKKRAISAATVAAMDAEYLYEWRARMERIGNQNYPTEARRLNLHGDVLLLVAINADGTLHEVQIHKSSGSKILDEAALRIVRLAAPFAPLPPEMRKNTDILEIIRTWQFGNNHWQQG